MDNQVDATYFSDAETFRLFDLCESNHIQSEEIIPVDVARDRKEKLCEYLRSKYIQRPHHEKMFFVKKIIRKYLYYQRYSRILLRNYRKESQSFTEKSTTKRKRLKVEKKRRGQCKKIPENHVNSLNNNYSPRKSGSESEGRERKSPAGPHRRETSQVVQQMRKNSVESQCVAKDLKREHSSTSQVKRKSNPESRKRHRKLNFDEMLLNIDSYYTKTIGRIKSSSRDSDSSSTSSESSRKSSSSGSSSSSRSSSTSSSSSSSSTSSLSSSSSRSATRSPYVKLERSVLIDKLGKMYT
uniref:Uncharacterized protein n=1 Tax=Lutzomyia longipalpis TaxID=7200 RepID=A0A1B0CPX8_LUTLO